MTIVLERLDIACAFTRPKTKRFFHNEKMKITFPSDGAVVAGNYKGGWGTTAATVGSSAGGTGTQKHYRDAHYQLTKSVHTWSLVLLLMPGS